MTAADRNSIRIFIQSNQHAIDDSLTNWRRSILFCLLLLYERATAFFLTANVYVELSCIHVQQISDKSTPLYCTPCSKV